MFLDSIVLICGLALEPVLCVFPCVPLDLDLDRLFLLSRLFLDCDLDEFLFGDLFLLVVLLL